MSDAIERIAAYLSQRRKAQGIDKERIHGFGLGPDCGVELLASDLRTLLAEADAMRRERDELRRWKSTNAPRLDALEGMLRAAQSGAAAGREAIASLSSERAANAILTSEVELLAARLAEIEAQQPSMYVLRSTAGSVRPTVVTRTSLLSCAQADRVDAGEDHLDPLFARPAPAAAPELEITGW